MSRRDFVLPEIEQIICCTVVPLSGSVHIIFPSLRFKLPYTAFKKNETNLIGIKFNKMCVQGSSLTILFFVLKYQKIPIIFTTR